MNEGYLYSYVDVNGKVIVRKVLSRIRMILFAGFKRITDILLSLIGLIISLPLMIIIAIAIKLDSKGPIFYKQRRTGFHGKEFNVYKFRSMVSDNDVHDFSTEDKYTKVGKFIRKLSLDELPQLWCIFTTKMSFIGPRPWIPDYYENMNEIQRHRCDVRPGLTGLAQVNGRNNITIFDKIKYDLQYIENYSLKQDIKIIFLTIKVVLCGSGVDAGKGTIGSEINDLKKQNK